MHWALYAGMPRRYLEKVVNEVLSITGQVTNDVPQQKKARRKRWMN